MTALLQFKTYGNEEQARKTVAKVAERIRVQMSLPEDDTSVHFQMLTAVPVDEIV